LATTTTTATATTSLPATLPHSSSWVYSRRGKRKTNEMVKKENKYFPKC